MRRLAKLGYRQFDVMVSPAHFKTEDLTPVDFRRLRKFLSDEGIAICAFTTQSLDHNPASPRAEIRTMTLQYQKSMLKVAAELDVPGILIISGRYNSLIPSPRAQMEGWLRQSLEELVLHAERVGVKIFLENAPNGVLPTAELLMNLMREIDSEALTICYDVANGHFIKEDLGKAIRLVAPKLGLIHLNDTTQDIYSHSPIGTGTADYLAVAEAVRDIDYKGMSVIEIISPNSDEKIVANHRFLETLGWEGPAAILS